jgi:hypothetical protein
MTSLRTLSGWGGASVSDSRHQPIHSPACVACCCCRGAIHSRVRYGLKRVIRPWPRTASRRTGCVCLALCDSVAQLFITIERPSCPCARRGPATIVRQHWMFSACTGARTTTAGAASRPRWLCVCVCVSVCVCEWRAGATGTGLEYSTRQSVWRRIDAVAAVVWACVMRVHVCVCVVCVQLAVIACCHTRCVWLLAHCRAPTTRSRAVPFASQGWRNSVVGRIQRSSSSGAAAFQQSAQLLSTGRASGNVWSSVACSRSRRCFSPH